MRTIGLSRRFVAWLLDVLIASLWIAALGEYRSGNGALEISWQGWRFVLGFLLLPLAYLILFEWLASATPGKFFVGIRVRRELGGRIGFGQAVGRNVARVVDAFPYVIPYLVGAIAISRSETKQRFGDRWAKTVVVLMGTDRPEDDGFPPVGRPGSTTMHATPGWVDQLPPSPSGSPPPGSSALPPPPPGP
jgi:uncharacterized RDD family membrane protein YckC